MKRNLKNGFHVLLIFMGLSACSKSEDCTHKAENLRGKWTGTISEIKTKDSFVLEETKNIVVDFFSTSEVNFSNFVFGDLEYFYHSDPERIAFLSSSNNNIILGDNVPEFVNVIKNTENEQIWESRLLQYEFIDSSLVQFTIFQTYHLNKK
ncbi:MAG: hypothetical protein R2774_02230 [Saprospiraceae bacterium]